MSEHTATSVAYLYRSGSWGDYCCAKAHIISYLTERNGRPTIVSVFDCRRPKSDLPYGTSNDETPALLSVNACVENFRGCDLKHHEWDLW